MVEIQTKKQKSDFYLRTEKIKEAPAAFRAEDFRKRINIAYSLMRRGNPSGVITAGKPPPHSCKPD